MDDPDIERDPSGLMEVRLTGAGATPEAISVTELVQFLSNMEQTLFQIAKSEMKAADVKGLYISLVEVREGSALFRFKPSLRNIALTAGATLAASTAAADYQHLPPEAISCYAKAVAFVQERQWRAEVKLSAADPQPALIIDERTARPELLTTTITGETTLYGEIERVGGADPRVVLRLPDSRQLSCLVSREQARRLAGRLYTQVGLRGMATWKVPDLDLMAFQVEELLDYESTPFADAMSSLAGDLRPHYRDVRSQETLWRELRGEGDGPEDDA